MKIFIKVLLAFGGIVLLGVLLFVGHYFATLRGREIHLIPSGYRGPVVIAYDMPNGVPARYEDGARVFEIPSDGILRTQMETPDDGWIRPGRIRYFYVDEKGQREEIPEVRWKEEMSQEAIAYTFRPIGNLMKPNGFESYVVGTIHEYTDSIFILQHEMLRKGISTEDQKPVTEIYVLPDGYQGPVAVFFDRADGVAAKYLGDVRIYEIPKDGVLYTRLPAMPGGSRRSTRRFYYVNRVGDSTELEEVEFSGEIPDSTNTYVRGGGVMRMERTEQKVTRYIVGTARTLDRASMEAADELVWDRWKRMSDHQ